MKKLLMAAALAAGVISANAQTTLMDQSTNFTGGAFLSQNTTDDALTSTYLFDDVVVGAAGWHINKITVYGDEGGTASSTTGIHVRFTQIANFTGPGTIGGQHDRAGFSGLSSGTLTLGVAITGDAGSLNINLGGGTWFMSAWIDRSFIAGGQWSWKTRTPVTGGEAIAHNPGGGLLGTTAPGTISSLAGTPPADLAFKIEGDDLVPEPATLLAIGAGLAALALRRRK